MKFKRLIAFLLSVSMIVGMMPAIVFASETDKDPDEPGTEETSGSESKESSKPQETKPAEPKETEPQETKPETEEPKETEPSEPNETAPAESKPSEPEETKATEPSAPEETEPEEQEETIPSDSDKKKAKNDGEVTVVDSGKCGDSIEWSLNSEGVLSISGSGEFNVNNSLSDVPWYDYVDQISEVKFSGDITNIPAHAFRNCTKLKSITIPETVTKIGASAFRDCTELTSITIPKKVESLGSNVFDNCSKLKKVEILGKISTIPSEAFAFCYSLADIKLPDSVESIGTSAFKECTSLTDIGFLGSVTSISKTAFVNCTGLKEITIPDTVNYISSNAFKNCSGLKKIIFPYSDIEINKDAFAQCDNVSVAIKRESYVQNAFPSSAKIHFYYSVDEFQNDGNGTVSAVGAVDGKLLTYGTDAIELTVTPKTNYVLAKLIWTSGNNSYELSPDVNGKYVMPDVETSSTAVIDAYFRSAGASGDCGDNLSWVLDKNGTLTISGSGAMFDWSDCTGANPAPWSSYDSSIEDVVISGNVTSIGNNAFAYCGHLTSVAIPESVTSIGDYAFLFCSSLTSILISKNTSKIGAEAFKECFTLQNFNFSGTEAEWDAYKNVLIAAGANLSYACICYNYYYIVVSNTQHGTVTVDKSMAPKDETVTITAIPDSGYMIDKIEVNGTAIQDNTFRMGDGKAIVTVTFKEIPASLNETIDDGVFEYTVTNANTDGSGTVTLMKYLNQDAAVTIPGTVVLKGGITYKVTRIGTKAFYGNTAVKTVAIGSFVTVIDSYAFCGCSNLIKISGGSRVQAIGSYAFANCARLSSFTVTSSALKKIGYYAFNKDKKLKTIYIRYTTKLSKSGVKKSLKGSSVKTVKVKKSKVKKYKKYFKKSNSGRKVKVKK